MARNLDNTTLRVWLALVSLGGYWTVRELREFQFRSLTAINLRPRLVLLADKGMAKTRTPRYPGQHPAYGVTAKCIAPPGHEHLLASAPQPGGSP